MPSSSLIFCKNQAYRLAQKFLSLFDPPPFVHAGHYYSPIPDTREVDRNSDALFNSNPNELRGIDLCREKQLNVLKELSSFYVDLPFTTKPSKGLRYYYGNDFFGHMDAIVLYGHLRALRPRRVIEVGSGFSSAVMLDTSQLFLSDTIKFSFIEPFPERLLSLLSPKDKEKHDIVAQPVQRVPLSMFKELNAGDILFIDSSHVSKTGSDANHLVFNVLPSLKPGVIVHFHDIFWPFEYPKEWIMQGRAWNEVYLIRAFLSFNSIFRIRLFNSFAGHAFASFLAEAMPLCLPCSGGSIWLEKTKNP